MSKIKSIADELRERIRAGSVVEDVPTTLEKQAAASAKVPPAISATVAMPDEAYQLFEQLGAFRMEGRQKIVIRLDAGSMRLLKQLKFTRDIDMTKVIVFAFHQFLLQHPWLKGYVGELVKKTEI